MWPVPLASAASRYRFSGSPSVVTRSTVGIRRSAPWKSLSAYLYESEAGDRQTALVVLEVCVERYGAGRVRARCERDEEGVVGESGHGLSAFLDRIFSAERLYPLRDGP